MNFYPPKINRHFNAPQNIGEAEGTNAAGTGASFICGSFARFFLEIDAQTKEIKDARFKSNGCGFAVAAADVLAEAIVGRKLNELHAFDERILERRMESELERFPEDRKHCAKICLDALRAAFMDFRSFQIEEFAGEKALICTCFGVSEEAIERVIEKNRSETVEEVTEICSAGGGCGSCRILIQEMIDVYWRENE